ncbi:MAG TPA: S8 family serine peptidase, partial [Aggregicoccus sp.]|nr:S8 family serine peptidase [Aggregicoccus sp.]
VAVIDTGIRNHPDLPRSGGRVLDGYDFISDMENAGDGNGRDSDPTDPGGDTPNGGSSWHGTHVAGTVGATSNNGSGVSGVDWRARILPVRVLGKAGGTSFDIVAAMDWAAGGSVSGVPQNPNPAHVVNLSLGGPGAPSQAYTDVVSRHPNTVFVVAAGNSNEPAEGFSPCNTPGLICVGSTAFSSRRSSFSNYGAAVDVMGAGGEMREDLNGDGYPDGVLSTSFDEAGDPVFAFENGTSMASPHVAGVVSLMLAALRERDPGATLSGADAERLLKATASPTPGCTEGCGAGLVNAGAAVARALGAAPTGPAQLAVSAQSLFFAGGGTQALTLYNQGGQPLTAAVSVQAGTLGADRVTLAPAGSVAVAPGAAAQLQLTVRADGLAAGDYGATLAVDAGTAGSASVALRLRVGTEEQDRDAVIAFAYLDAAGEWKVDEAGVGVVPAAQGYQYVMTLTPRDYYVLATIDDDGDGEYFEEDTDRIGFWRNVDEFEPVTVRAGERVDNVSFDVVPLQPVEAPSQELLIGAPCTSDADCPDGGSCFTAAEDLWPGGYCTRECTSLACPAASTCYPFQGGTRQCLEDCVGAGTSSHSCREGYVCLQLVTGSASGTSCYPDCDTTGCDTGQSCDADGYCR